MIPILYDSTETMFGSNGLGRLRDCISCTVTEERNGIYECDFDYPIDGAHFSDIKCGRIIAVTHDDTGDVQPFDIVSYTRPINGVVSFHAQHISYRQSMMVARGTNINSISDAFTMLGNAAPSNPFSYSTDVTGTGYMAAADGMPRTVRSLLGGVEGSILDTYGGEYEWDKFNVILHAARGQTRDFIIRYGVNLLDYNEDTDYGSTFRSIIPYWAGTDSNGSPKYVVGDMQTYGQSTVTGRNETIPLDVTDKFQSEPTKAQVEAEGVAYLNRTQPVLPQQTIEVDFVNLADSEAQFAPLLRCRLCDSIRVVFPLYGMSGWYKIVKVEYNVLLDKFNKLELGTLSTSLSEALGISNSLNTPSGGGGSTPGGDISCDSLTASGDITAGGTVTGSNFTTINTEDGSTVSLSNGSVKNLKNINLAAGTYLCIGTATFAANSSGRRGLYFSTVSGTTAGDGRYKQIECASAGSSEVHLQLVSFIKLESAGTLYLNARQNSGSSLNATYPGITYIKLG